MANEKNLEGHGFDERSASEVREISAKGGINSGKARRQKRLLADICNMIGAMKSNSPLVVDLPEDERTKDAEVAMSMYMAAQSGDTKAATWIRDTKGESKTQLEVTENKEILFVRENGRRKS